MKILADFYLAFALILVVAAAGLVVWQLWIKPEHTSRLKVAAVLLAISALISIGCLAYFGAHLMDHGDCPYTEPLAPCPVTPTTRPSQLMQPLPTEPTPRTPTASTPSTANLTMSPARIPQGQA